MGLDLVIGRADGMQDHAGSEAGTMLAAYSYLGLDTIVQQTDGNGETLSYISQDDDSNPPPTTATSGGDQYTGLDEFGRVVDQNWFNSSGGTIDRYQYGYDADGNVLYSDNIVSSGNSELYTYDGLNRLSTYEVGTLNSGDNSITSPTVDESWSLDALGNWNSETTLAGTTDNTINSQNQITAIGSTSLTYDDNGNTLTDGTGASYTYDAWNRMVSVAGVPLGAATYHESLSYTASGSHPFLQQQCQRRRHRGHARWSGSGDRTS